MVRGIISPWFFRTLGHSDTIMENIRYGNQDVSDEEVLLPYGTRADRFIKTLLATSTGRDEDATNISEGQK